MSMFDRAETGISEWLLGVFDFAELVKGSTANLAVTGLSRAGKTVFITSLVHNLLSALHQPHRMPLLKVVGEGRLVAARLASGKTDRLPRFPYERNIEHMAANPADWPARTTNISEIEIDIRFVRGATRPPGSAPAQHGGAALAQCHQQQRPDRCGYIGVGNFDRRGHAGDRWASGSGRCWQAGRQQNQGKIFRRQRAGSSARPEAWGKPFLNIPVFEPPVIDVSPIDGIAHINLDLALEYLIGDQLR